MSQQSAFEYLRHGQTPFFRLPSVDPRHLASTAPSAGAADAVIVGVPHDGGTTYQPGARFAPFHVRRVSALVQSYHPFHRVDVFGRLRAADGGNVVFPPFDRESMREAVQGATGAVLRAGATPFLVGGDHSITLPALRAVAAAAGPVALVHVDAHLDTSGPEVWGDAFHHGTPIRHALSEGLIARGHLYQIGVRAPWSSSEDGAPGASHGARALSADEVGVRGIESIMAEVREHVADRAVYVTFDVDGVDPAFAPGTGTPVPGGLTAREALGLLRGLAGANLVGMDVVEVAPGLDHADITSHLAAHLLYEGLALAALRR
jgi:agmatinase